MHISKNCAVTEPRLMSKILIVMGFIFSTPVSDEPSTDTEKGYSFIVSTRFSLKCGAIAPFITQAVFVRLEENLVAISLSGNIS